VKKSDRLRDKFESSRRKLTCIGFERSFTGRAIKHFIGACVSERRGGQQEIFAKKAKGVPTVTPIIRISVLVAMSAALTPPLASVARAHCCTQSKQVNRRRANATAPSRNGIVRGYLDGFPDQTSARAAHPITQGGTTGGTVNPGLTSDHRQHGYNG
jgi:hypothetical protein